MKLLITRPELDARALGTRLNEAGFETLVSPLMEIVPTDAAPDIGNADALVFTSRNAVEALGLWLDEGSPLFDKPVYLVGEKTAAAARKIGFDNCLVADGSVDDLITLISQHPHKGETWAYISGDPIKRELDAPLEALGITLTRHVVYEARAIDDLNKQAVDALSNGEIDAVVFYSPRSVTLFTTALEKAGLNSAVEDLRALCLSDAIGDEARAHGFDEIWVAHRPNTDALIEGLKKAAEGKADMSDETVSKPKKPVVKYLPWALLFIALVFIAGLFSASKIPFLAPPPPEPVVEPASSGLADAVSTLVGRINDLQQRMKALEDAPAPVDNDLATRVETLESVQPAQVDLQPLINKLNALEQRIAAYEAAGGGEVTVIPQGPDPELLARIDELEARLAQTGQRVDNSKPALGLLSFATLKDQIATGAVYQNSLKSLGTHIGENSLAFQALKSHAATGVKTDAALSEDFSRIGNDLLLAAKTPEDAGWWERFLARMQTVVTIRKTGDVDGASPEARLSRLEARVLEKNWPGALAALNEFPAYVCDVPAVKDWAEQVRIKVEVENALGDLERLLNRPEAE